MLTSFGKALRGIRMDKDELLKDMADKLGVTSAYLSAIENGKRDATEKLLMNIVSAYSLDEDARSHLEESFAVAQKEVKFSLGEMTKKQQDLSLIFARNATELGEDQIEEIMEIILKKRTKE